MKLSKADIGFILLKRHLDDIELIDAILEYCTKYKNDYTRCTKISAFKCYLRDAKLLADQGNLNLIIDHALTQRLKDKLNNSGLPDKRPVGQHIIDKLLGYKDSQKRDEMFIYLLLVTGRRPSEFLDGKWRICEQGRLWINKLSKKGSQFGHPKCGYHINLIGCSPDGFMDVYGRFDKSMFMVNGSRIKNSSIIDSAGYTLRSVTDRYLSLASLRPLYVLLHQMSDPESLTNDNTRIKNLLHHENHASSPHYNSRFYIEPESHITETLILNKNL